LSLFLIKKIFIMNRNIQIFILFFFIHVFFMVDADEISNFFTFQRDEFYSRWHLLFNIMNHHIVMQFVDVLLSYFFNLFDDFCECRNHCSKFSHNFINIEFIFRENISEIFFTSRRKISNFLTHLFGLRIFLLIRIFHTKQQSLVIPQN